MKVSHVSIEVTDDYSLPWLARWNDQRRLRFGDSSADSTPKNWMLPSPRGGEGRYVPYPIDEVRFSSAWLLALPLRGRRGPDPHWLNGLTGLSIHLSMTDDWNLSRYLETNRFCSR
jgi:hypothetical protein